LSLEDYGNTLIQEAAFYSKIILRLEFIVALGLHVSYVYPGLCYLILYLRIFRQKSLLIMLFFIGFHSLETENICGSPLLASINIDMGWCWSKESQDLWLGE
jgi:hypothetical protein